MMTDRRLADEDIVATTATTTTSTSTTKPWIRGVNLGGWLLMERFITPYQFALTTCHLEGDFCWYPGQINAPPNAELCDVYRCKPVLQPNVFGQIDYPMDEYSLWKSFGNSSENIAVAEQWLNYHLEYFITEDDIIAVKNSGATHVRVPLAHWILQSQEDVTASGMPWIVGKRWQAFQRVVEWSRKHGLQVWPDIHTAPDSQNGFDNSGQQMTVITCKRWSDNPDNVAFSLDVVRNVTKAIADENMQDVVTGFGVVNEPFKDCDREVYLEFIQAGFDVVRQNMGPDAYVYVSDLFQPELFNDGKWWLDPKKYHNTFIDTHYYHVFAETTRAISPRQHIALTCQNEYHKNRNAHKTQGGVSACCFQDPPYNTIPSDGVRHMVGEWSVATDTLPGDMLYKVMESIADSGIAFGLDREISPDRADFLRSFSEAQMVVYEMADKGAGGSWFYWTVKMEGGAFAEWDYLRGVKEGWIPKLPSPDVASVTQFGTCYDIMNRTSDSMSIIHEFPNALDDSDNWQGTALDDDVVVSHGESVLNPAEWRRRNDLINSDNMGWWIAGLVMAVVAIVVSVYRRCRSRGSLKPGYTSLPQSST